MGFLYCLFFVVLVVVQPRFPTFSCIYYQYYRTHRPTVRRKRRGRKERVPFCLGSTFELSSCCVRAFPSVCTKRKLVPRCTLYQLFIGSFLYSHIRFFFVFFVLFHAHLFALLLPLQRMERS
ncbi:hypothetical protein BKA57DRAFT_96676 [Linnemannia elongata]|nr:hypothetical protein BKA57DRAFT_96676 [Linnemannia elongata]